jgi:hypothetical protein
MELVAKNLVEFLDKAGSKGRIRPDMAAQLSGATKKILEIEQDWEEIDLSQLDVEGLIVRFRNLKGLDYTPNSLTEYERRFRRAIEMFLKYAEDPNWTHNGQSSQVKKNNAQQGSSKTKSKRNPPTQNEIVETSNIAINSAGIQMMDYPFPLRESCVVRLRLPADLKIAEVERLAAFMRSVAIDLNRFRGDLPSRHEAA